MINMILYCCFIVCLSYTFAKREDGGLALYNHAEDFSLLNEKKIIEIKSKGILFFLEVDPIEKKILMFTDIYSEKFYVPLKIRQYCGYYNAMMKGSNAPYFQFHEKSATIKLCQKICIKQNFSVEDVIEKFSGVTIKWAGVLKEILV
jgi:hypothetical protein